MPRKSPKPRDTKSAGRHVGQLISVGAFWKNDKPGGIGFVLHADTIGAYSIQILNANLQEALESYRKHDDPSYIPVYFSQLEEAASARRRDVPFDNRLIIVVIANIAYLVEIGALKSDNWNGVVYTYDA